MTCRHAERDDYFAATGRVRDGLMDVGCQLQVHYPQGSRTISAAPEDAASDLAELLRSDRRGLIVSMIHKFDGIDADVCLRPNVFVLYEQNIGMLTPMIAEELRDAEKHYPEDWIPEAFREAVELNKRSWRYVLRILERWRAEGKDAGKAAAEPPRDGPGRRRRYVPDEYEGLIEH